MKKINYRTDNVKTYIAVIGNHLFKDNIDIPNKENPMNLFTMFTSSIDGKIINKNKFNANGKSIWTFDSVYNLLEIADQTYFQNTNGTHFQRINDRFPIKKIYQFSKGIFTDDIKIVSVNNQEIAKAQQYFNGKFPNTEQIMIELQKKCSPKEFEKLQRFSILNGLQKIFDINYTQELLTPEELKDSPYECILLKKEIKLIVPIK